MVMFYGGDPPQIILVIGGVKIERMGKNMVMFFVLNTLLWFHPFVLNIVHF